MWSHSIKGEAPVPASCVGSGAIAFCGPEPTLAECRYVGVQLSLCCYERPCSIFGWNVGLPDLAGLWPLMTGMAFER